MTDHPAAESERSSAGVFAPALRRWPLLLLLAVAGGTLGFLGFSLQSPVFESSARVQVSKRFDPNAAEGRMVYVEDYVATVTQIIGSDEVLGEAAVTLRSQAGHLTQPLAESEAVQPDGMKAALAIVRIRDPNSAATTSSSALTLKYTCGDPGDAKKVLDAVIAAVQKYLDRGFSDALKSQQDEVAATIERRKAERMKLFTDVNGLRASLALITPEDLPIVRGRVSANYERAFVLNLELALIVRDLKGIGSVGPTPEARLLKLRQLLGTNRTPGEATGPTAAESLFVQLNARRIELAERMGKDHPTLKELDAQIKFHQELLTRSIVPTGGKDELALYGDRLQERKEAAEAQLATVTAQLNEDKGKVLQGGKFQDEIEVYRRQLDELTLDISRLEDRKLTLSALQQKETSRRAYDIRPLDKPRIGRKVGPNLVTWVAPGVLLGLLLAVGLAFLAEMADQGFRNPAEIRRRLGVPVFGHVPAIRLDQPATADVSATYDPSLVVARRPKSVEAETYRGVRTQLLVAVAAGQKTVQVTSPNPGDGKSTTAANLAISLAQAGKRVALIDADFRKPRIHALFDLPRSEVGLASVVADEAVPLSAALRPCDVDNLSLLPCGTRPANPAELLASPRFQTVLDELKGMFDFVIIDTPPLLAVSDPLLVAQHADAVVLVFGITRRSRPQVERSRELLADSGATLLGVVVNGADNPASGYGYSAGSSRYAYEYQYTEQYADADDQN